MWRKSSYELPVKWRILILCYNGSIFLTAGIKKVVFWNQSPNQGTGIVYFFFFYWYPALLVSYEFVFHSAASHSLTYTHVFTLSPIVCRPVMSNWHKEFKFFPLIFKLCFYLKCPYIRLKDPHEIVAQFQKCMDVFWVVGKKTLCMNKKYA